MQNNNWLKKTIRLNEKIFTKLPEWVQQASVTRLRDNYGVVRDVTLCANDTPNQIRRAKVKQKA